MAAGLKWDSFEKEFDLELGAVIVLKLDSRLLVLEIKCGNTKHYDQF